MDIQNPQSSAPEAQPPPYSSLAFPANNKLQNVAAHPQSPYPAYQAPNPAYQGPSTQAPSTPQRVPSVRGSTVPLVNNFAANNNLSDKAIRRGFIRKVYLILMAQILCTAAVVCCFMFVPHVKPWVQVNWGAYLAAYIIFIVTFITLYVAAGLRRSYPGNMIALFIFTLSFSYLLGTIASFHDVYAVMIATIFTAALCLGLTCFAMQSRIEYTICIGLLVAFVLCMVYFAVAAVFFATIPYTYYSYYITWYSRQYMILQCLYGALGATLFGIIFVIDTHLIITNEKYGLSSEEYVFAALQLYIDIMYIFIMILLIVGGGRK